MSKVTDILMLNNNIPLSIRRATISDLDALEELEFDCFDSDRFSRRRWRYLLQQANAVTLVLDTNSNAHTIGGDEQLLGYAMLLLRMHSQRALLHSLCVHPRVQRQGLGAKLLTTCESLAKAKGANMLWLDVHAENSTAQRLYQRHGYYRYAWEDNVYEDGGAAWRMEKLLSSTT